MTSQTKSRKPLFLWLDEFWEAGCPTGVGYTLLALSKFADNDTLRAYPSRERLARMCGTTERSVDRHIAEAVKQGWVVRVRRGKTGRNTEYRLAVGRPWNTNAANDTGSDDREEVPIFSLQTPASVPQTLVSVETDASVAPTAQRTPQRTVETRSGIADRTADDRSIDVEKNNLTDLPAIDWLPNDVGDFAVNPSHVSKANKAQVSAVAVAGVFRDWCRAANVVSWDLDAKFGALLDEIWMDGDPDAIGFREGGMRISEFASVDGCSCREACLWWRHPAYRVDVAVGTG